jgi:hypothetical protein
MDLESLEFNSADELMELIRRINMKYYIPFTKNVCYLEERSDAIYFVYIITLKDAYSHLVSAFDYDILSLQGRKNIQSQIFLYADHLKEGLMDTFRKIVEVELNSIKKSIPKKELKAIEVQVAQKTSELRVKDKNTTIDKRIDGYKSLLDYLEEIRKKFSLS